MESPRLTEFKTDRNDSHSTSEEKKDTISSVTLYTCFSPRSHFLVGPFLVKYAEFRMEHLTPNKKFSYNGRIALGKGWLIPRDSLDALADLLGDAEIPFKITECPRKQRAHRPSYRVLVSSFKETRTSLDLDSLAERELVSTFQSFVDSFYRPSGSIRRYALLKALDRSPSERMTKKGTASKKTAPSIKVTPSKKTTLSIKATTSKKRTRKPYNYMARIAVTLDDAEDGYLGYEELLEHLIERCGKTPLTETYVRNRLNEGLQEGYFRAERDNITSFVITSLGRRELLGC